MHPVVGFTRDLAITQKITGTQFQFVPYKAGSSDIIRDIIAGHIDFTFDQAITSLTRDGTIASISALGGQSATTLRAIATLPLALDNRFVGLRLGRRGRSR